MNKRIRNKKDKKAIEIAMKVLYMVSGYPDGYPTYWKSNSEISRKDMKHGIEYWESARSDYKDELLAKEILLKVVRKCLIDEFPIEDYALFEIPYSDKNGWILDFVNIKEYEEYHTKGNKNIDIHELDFFCPFNSKTAVPQGMKNSIQYDCDNCFDAVFVN